jgi:hypothetical protein
MRALDSVGSRNDFHGSQANGCGAACSRRAYHASIEDQSQALHAQTRGALPERLLTGRGHLEQVILLSLVKASVAFTLSETTAFAGFCDWEKGRSA